MIAHKKNVHNQLAPELIKSYIKAQNLYLTTRVKSHSRKRTCTFTKKHTNWSCMFGYARGTQEVLNACNFVCMCVRARAHVYNMCVCVCVCVCMCVCVCGCVCVCITRVRFVTLPNCNNKPLFLQGIGCDLYLE